MALKVPDLSESLLLKFLLGKSTPAATWTLRLFVNNKTPAAADAIDASDYTEMTTQDYTPISLTQASWTVTEIDPESQAAYAEQTFTFDGSGGDTVVYGYYITDDTTDQLVCAERFPSPPTVPDTLGGTIKVTLQITLVTAGE